MRKGFASVKREKSRSWTAAAAAVVCVAVFFLAKHVCVEAAYPALRLKNILERHVVSRLCGMWRGAEAEAEARRLRAEIGLLSSVESDNAKYLAEIDRLRGVLGYSAKERAGYIPAEVLSRDGGAAAVRKTIRVGKGSLAGVEKGAVVVAKDGLVGKVSEVTLHTANVVLITDPSMKVSCTIEGCPGATGVLCGGEDDTLWLKWVSGDAKPSPRAGIYTSGLGGVFPEGLKAGTLSSEDAVLSAVDFRELEDVYIRREK